VDLRSRVHYRGDAASASVAQYSSCPTACAVNRARHPGLKDLVYAWTTDRDASLSCMSQIIYDRAEPVTVSRLVSVPLGVIKHVQFVPVGDSSNAFSNYARNGSYGH
jgi:hypothetical protein